MLHPELVYPLSPSFPIENAMVQASRCHGIDPRTTCQYDEEGNGNLHIVLLLARRANKPDGDTTYFHVTIRQAELSQLPHIPYQHRQSCHKQIKAPIHECRGNLPGPHLPRVGSRVWRRLAVSEQPLNPAEAIREDGQPVQRDSLVRGGANGCQRKQ